AGSAESPGGRRNPSSASNSSAWSGASWSASGASAWPSSRARSSSVPAVLMLGCGLERGDQLIEAGASDRFEHRPVGVDVPGQLGTGIAADDGENPPNRLGDR